MSIRVENLIHIYDKGMPTEQLALDNISFTAEDGQMVGIIGHTGSGKSTLLQHLNGLLKPDSGRIVIGGTDITEPGVSMVQIRKKIGLVFQYPEYQLFEETVGKDIAYGPTNMGLDAAEIERRVAQAMEDVGLDVSLRDKSPFELSGGQKRRVALAGVVAMQPEILVLDEPTAGLDPAGRREMFELIRRLHDLHGTTIVLVTHSMEDAARMADRLVVMQNGRVFLTGKPEEVFARADELEQAGLTVPQVTKILLELKKRGIPVDTGCYTIEQAVAQLLAYKQAGGKNGC